MHCDLRGAVTSYDIIILPENEGGRALFTQWSSFLNTKILGTFLVNRLFFMIRSMSQRRLSASSSRGGSAPAVSVAGSAPGGGGGDICSVRGTESRVCPSDDDDPTGVGGGPGDSLGGGGGGVGTGWNSDDEDLEQV